MNLDLFMILEDFERELHVNGMKYYILNVSDPPVTT